MVYKLIYRRQDYSILDGKSCAEEQRISYAACIEQALGNEFISAYGCLPPWWPTQNNITCEHDLPPKQITGATLRNMVAYIDSLSDGLDIAATKQCLPPCVTTHVKVSVLDDFRSFPAQAKMKVLIPSRITTLKAVYSYTFFNLIIEFGSSLGLWLGLCVISLFDLSLGPLNFLKYKIVNLLKN